MQFFKEENHKVVVDPEIKIVREFRALIAADKDRNKREAVKWFAYIYYMNDYRSPYFNLSPDDRHDSVCKDVMLDTPFKVPNVLQAAIDKYNELQETVSVRTLKSIREGLIMSNKVIDMINTQIQNTLDRITDSGDDPDTLHDDINMLTSNVDKLLGMSDKVPKAISTIEALEDQIKKEQANDTKIRGGGNKGFFED